MIAWLDEQEANAEVEEVEGKQWGHDDVTGFLGTIVGGFMDGFGIADAFGAGRDQQVETKQLVEHTRDLQLEEEKRDKANAGKVAAL